MNQPNEPESKHGFNNTTGGAVIPDSGHVDLFRAWNEGGSSAWLRSPREDHSSRIDRWPDYRRIDDAALFPPVKKDPAVKWLALWMVVTLAALGIEAIVFGAF